MCKQTPIRGSLELAGKINYFSGKGDTEVAAGQFVKESESLNLYAHSYFRLTRTPDLRREGADFNSCEENAVLIFNETRLGIAASM